MSLDRGCLLRGLYDFLRTYVKKFIIITDIPHQGRGEMGEQREQRNLGEQREQRELGKQRELGEQREQRKLGEMITNEPSTMNHEQSTKDE
ncbi:MAG: hypothetical protein RID09_05680 [Coleofasciculus sp. G1-WW12-02]|uniref:hypothetical protein n=1 Tax=Coleofasciculus sp. G1-WW12-02 TaxID=3068483 RepID=UPI003303197A